MLPAPKDFCAGITLDCHLLHQSVASGQTAPSEILSLAAAAQALFITTTIVTRQMGRIKDRHHTWREAAEIFDELAQTWADMNSNDPQIQWLRSRLRHFQTLAIDQTRTYEVTAAERLQHAKNREDLIETYHQRNDNVPADTLDQSSPAHVYRLSPSLTPKSF